MEQLQAAAASVRQAIASERPAGSEIGLCTYGQIHGLNKVNMAHRTADRLVYCHETMHTQLRMQNAGWSADVEPWGCSDDDSASDNSGATNVQDEDDRVLTEAQILRLTV